MFFGQPPSKVMWTNGLLTPKPCFSQSIWSLLYDVNQLFSQKWRSRLSKANFCSKTVDSVFTVFLFSFNVFPSKLITIVVNQLFSQKWSSKLSKANFCSKTVGTVFAIFFLHSTSFSINLIIIVWCQSIFFSETEPKVFKMNVKFSKTGLWARGM